MRIDYPVAVDNDYAVWSAFDNNYWPALYFADAQGRIRHHHFGEGEYQQSEMVIQQLLVEAGTTDHDHELVSVEARGAFSPMPDPSTTHPRFRDTRSSRYSPRCRAPPVRVMGAKWGAIIGRHKATSGRLKRSIPMV